MSSPAPDSVVLLDQQHSAARWLLFSNPIKVVQTYEPKEVLSCLVEVERLTQQGMYAAGFVTYEAASAFDPALSTHEDRRLPLIWFGLYDGCQVVSLEESDVNTFSLGPWTPTVSLDEYRRAIESIKDAIRRGDTYQVNYTLRMRSTLEGDPWQLFLTLHQAQRGKYSAYLNLGQYHICSASPELFVAMRNHKLTCKPMKGTVKRGLNFVEDSQAEQWLRTSEKNQAENVMIVDMIRNDMGRVAETGSVSVTDLFRIERYPTVLQMTSTVEAEVSCSVSKIIQEMFPCASITGAPKVSTMSLIRELEAHPRGVYTGSIGYIAPHAEICQFNVAIRSAVVDVINDTVEFGVGSGVVWDSDADDEYRECGTKSRILFDRYPDFDIIETLLWTPTDGYFLLEQHLTRLRNSASYFQYPLSESQLRSGLAKQDPDPNGGRQKVRVTLSRSGVLSITCASCERLVGAKVALAQKPIVSSSPFLYHKTSYRHAYSQMLEEHRARQSDIVDLILWSGSNSVTESSIANVVVKREGEFVTPSLNRGLLPGVYRERLIQGGVLKECDVRVEELHTCDALYLINSVRGWMALDRADSDTWIVTSEFTFETPRSLAC